MGITFTPAQEKVLQSRGHNVLVSAAAGSGKTAVLVERIIRMITEGDHPLDIDHLLVVTFTRAAAAEMRERIGRAISARLVQDPENRHLQEQETLLHNAKITTIDSFCTYLLRNNFADIGLDPGFRQMDETESSLLMHDCMETYLESCYEKGGDEFQACLDTFCPGVDDKGLEDLIFRLFNVSNSHPFQREWLLGRRQDYEARDEEELLRKPWMQALIRDTLRTFRELYETYDTMLRICELPGGPYPLSEFLRTERDSLFAPFLSYAGGSDETGGAAGEPEDGRDPFTPGEPSEDLERCRQVLGYHFDRIPAIRAAKYPDIDPEQKNRTAGLRDRVKDAVGELKKQGLDLPLPESVRRMQLAAGPLRTLIDLTLGFIDAFDALKKERNCIDFADLERDALQILLERRPDGTLAERRAAAEYRQYFDEILIDEYQDSNEVQELLLGTIAGEAQGVRKRFMVGDVKQSIYRFRNARPEIFVEKYDTYRADDPEEERIDLDQNFRSRKEVLDVVNALFGRLMRKEIGGIDYDEAASLKPGAVFPMPEEGSSPYTPELLVVDGSTQDREEAEKSSGEKDTDQKSSGRKGSGEPEPDDGDDAANLTNRKKQALAVADRIRGLVGKLPVRDEKTGTLRPAKYSDIVILVRSAVAWNAPIREIFDRQGIPVYVEERTGYFAAEEIRQVLQYLRVMDNPLQDIPLYGALRGYFGGFSESEIALIRSTDRQCLLYDNLQAFAGREESAGTQRPLAEHCRSFLGTLAERRKKAKQMPVHRIVDALIFETGYSDYVSALPAGEQRRANLHSLEVKAKAFEQTAYTGLFQFLRYIDSMHDYEVDYGEENVLDEKADVVRVLTIHKSKGLEFPVCIVAGLETRFAFRGRDTGAALIADPDLGLGVDTFDPELRLKTGNIRKSAVAKKIRRDAMGEELRVLYVALTRAREKLILTGFSPNAETKILSAQGYVCAPDTSRAQEKCSLPASAIGNAVNYLDLILKSNVLTPQVIRIRDLQVAEQEDLERLGKRLAALQKPAGGSAAAEAAELLKRFRYRYPHENLAGLYTKTTVTELKRASMEELPGETGEGADTLYPAAPALPEPKFLARDAGGDGPVRLSGAERGTAVHRGCELLDFRSMAGPGRATAKEIEAFVERQITEGRIPAEYRSVLTPGIFLPLLGSGLAVRMAAAQEKGWLLREQPFVLGLPASDLKSSFPENETILVQGIIDAFFLEQDPETGAKHLVIVDYKTDAVKTPGELLERYRTQLEYYARALEGMLHLPVAEKILYSFRLRQAVEVD